MINLSLSCENCGKTFETSWNPKKHEVVCDHCQFANPLHVGDDQNPAHLRVCPVCEGTKFYKQKDFNRKVGVFLFIVASILSLFTYGISFIIFYLVDYFLFNKVNTVVICYTCESVFRDVLNVEDIPAFDHETHDRIAYKNH